MTDDVGRFAFLLRQKPVCTQSPIKNSLGPDRHRELRAKYKLELGIDLLEDRCPNAFNCISTNSGCIGRPFPIDSEVAQALSNINVEVAVGSFKGKEVYLAKALVDCSTCPFRVGCESACATQEAYLRKSTKPDLSPKSYMMVNFEDNENRAYESLVSMNGGIGESDYDSSWRSEELPLDCLTAKQRQVVEMTLYDGKSQVQIAHELGIDQSVVSRHYDSAISRLEEFAKARKVIREHGCTLRVSRYYRDNMSQTDIAQVEGVKLQSVSESIIRWGNKWNI